jgi:hypothetical protein
VGLVVAFPLNNPRSKTSAVKIITIKTSEVINDSPIDLQKYSGNIVKTKAQRLVL